MPGSRPEPGDLLAELADDFAAIGRLSAEIEEARKRVVANIAALLPLFEEGESKAFHAGFGQVHVVTREGYDLFMQALPVLFRDNLKWPRTGAADAAAADDDPFPAAGTAEAAEFGGTAAVHLLDSEVS